MISRAMVARKPGSPGRARRKPLKPFAQGVPECFGEPVVTYSCGFFIPTRGYGCDEHPAFPAPSAFRGTLLGTARARCAPREGIVMIAYPGCDEIRSIYPLRRKCAPSPALAGEGGVGVFPQEPTGRGDRLPPPAALWRAIALPSASTSPASGRGEVNVPTDRLDEKPRSSCGPSFETPLRGFLG